MSKINTIRYKSLIENNNVAKAPWQLSFVSKVANCNNMPIIEKYEDYHFSSKQVKFVFFTKNTVIEKTIPVSDLNDYIINFETNFLSVNFPVDENSFSLIKGISDKSIKTKIIVFKLKDNNESCLEWQEFDLKNPEFILNDDGSVTLNIEINESTLSKVDR